MIHRLDAGPDARANKCPKKHAENDQSKQQQKEENRVKTMCHGAAIASEREKQRRGTKKNPAKC